MNIRELEAATGQPARNIRHLIAQGIVPEPSGKTRAATYGAEHVRALEIYAAAKAEGVGSLDVIKGRVAAGGDASGEVTLRPCDGVEVRIERAALEALAPLEILDRIREALVAAGRREQADHER